MLPSHLGADASRPRLAAKPNPAQPPLQRRNPSGKYDSGAVLQSGESRGSDLERCNSLYLNIFVS